MSEGGTCRAIVLANGQQLELLDPAEIEVAEIQEDERRGIFSGDRLAAKRPETYRQIVTLLAAGCPLRRIASQLRVSPHTIMAIRRREGAAIGATKARVGRLFEVVSETAAERLAEALAELPVENWQDAQRLGIIAGIATEKAQLLTGGATARVEHRDAERLEDLADVLAGLSHTDAIDVESTPVATGSPANTREQKEATAAGQAAPDHAISGS